ncbi:YHS domain-containing protein [Caulobacter sp. LjRoot300]|uniref:YHS domain-containing protein n=1 Tax=Caulobacter sp. LjRoot300 TaxID=3342321 RepID=UPI003ED04CE2
MSDEGHAPGRHRHDYPGHDTSSNGMAVDPVCGMTVDAEAARYRAQWSGHRFVFCSTGCKTRFEAEPERYVGPKSAAAAGTVFTCPMHPEIRQVGPGVCPICGMDAFGILGPMIALLSGRDVSRAEAAPRIWDLGSETFEAL